VRLAAGLRPARAISDWRNFGSIAPATLDVDLVLQIENAVERAVEAVGPDVSAGRRVDQLAGNPLIRPVLLQGAKPR
jgi:hypothetical protein